MSAQRSIFRKVALERLSSPEQLDQMLQVTNPRAWLALLGLLILLGAVIVWSILGSIPIKIASPVILLQSGGVKQVAATASGQVETLLVGVGDSVTEGEVIAEVKGLSNETLSQVVSPYTGNVLEVRVDEGNLIDLGTPLLSLEPTGEGIELEAILYVPAADGNRLAEGMEVQIAPANVRQEEHGFMVGRVISVSPFPSTYQGMLRTLGSDELVQTFSASGAPLEVIVALEPDASTASGYRWSSAEGPAVEIRSGTLGTASIIVGEQQPIDYVLP